jgi:hypothetical protein
MLLTIIVFYSFIVRCLKREKFLVAPEKVPGEYLSSSTTSYSVTSDSTSSITTTSIAYNHFNENILKDTALSNRDKEKRAAVESSEKDNPNDGKEPYSDDEVADDNQFDEEEFYNIIATKAAGFQFKRNSSTSTLSSGSIYDDTYRTKRNSLRSQSSTCSDIVETTAETMSNRRSSEDRIQNRKLNYKTRRHGFTMLSKRRRTTGRYFL